MSFIQRSWYWIADRIRTIRFQDILTLLVAIALAMTTWLAWQSYATNTALQTQVRENTVQNEQLRAVSCDQKIALQADITSAERVLALPTAEEVLDSFGYTIKEAERELLLTKERLATYESLEC